MSSTTSSLTRPLSLLGKVAAGFLLSLSVILPAQAFSPLSGPVESTKAVPPNVVILFDSSSSMQWRVRDNTVPTVSEESRLKIAKEVVEDVLTANRYLRFGLFDFRPSQRVNGDRDAPGGRLLAPVGTVAPETQAGRDNFSALINAVRAINPVTPRPWTDFRTCNRWTGVCSFDQSAWDAHLDTLTLTPLAESYYEVTRYMRGLRAFYPQTTTETSRVQFQSPIQYRCQKNFGLIITDGLPTYDNQFPTSLAGDPDGDNPLVSGGFNLPNWDGDATGDITLDSNGNPQSLLTEGSTFFLNDIAKFAYDIDLRNTARAGVTNDLAGKSWDDRAFPIQNMRTFTVGFALDDPRLRSVARAGNGSYYTANDRASLTAALNQALLEINAAAGSGGGGAVSSAELTAGTLYYRTSYDPESWRGEIQAVNLETTGALGTLAWTTNNTMTPAARAGLYQTWNANSRAVVTLGGATFAGLPTDQQNVLTAAAVVVAPTATGQGLLNWAIGATNAAPYRVRTGLLGDVINSSPAFADPVQATLLRSDAIYTGYTAYLATKATNMVPSLIVGSNDGFLHVLAARQHTLGATVTPAGNHRLAYLPAAMHAGLGARARPDYGQASAHVSGVDGNIVVGDALLSNRWTTLALAGFGAGGKGLVATRLFDARSGDGNAALGGLWEIGPSSSGFADIGHIYGRAVVGRHNGEWVAVTGNGYGGASGQAVLYIIKLADGSLIKSIPVGSAGGNGLSAPRVQLDQAGNIVEAYAGDLKGQLWKFRLSGDQPNAWGSAFSAEGTGAAVPLFTAASNQPITVTPELYRHPEGGQLVLFGTGKFMEQSDLLSTAEQAFYAVWDKPNSSGGLVPSDLLAQSILSETTVRTVSNARVNWLTQSGWYLPLKVGANLKGERVVRNSIVRGNRVFFNTGFIDSASNDPCVSNANGWLMALDIFSGGRLATALFDTNNDGVIDARDNVTAGLKLDIGLPGDLNFATRPSSGRVLEGWTGSLPNDLSSRPTLKIGEGLRDGLLRPIPELDEDGKPMPITGDYMQAGKPFCNKATETCECPIDSADCVSPFTRPNCNDGVILVGGSRDVARIDTGVYCWATRINWRQRM